MSETESAVTAAMQPTWFEFLLNENFLEEHLAKPIPTPCATELISQFLYQADAAAVTAKDIIDITNSENKDDPEACVAPVTETKKIKALRLLALKAAAHLKWNLEVLEKGIPLAMVYAILVELLKVTVTDNLDICDPEAVDFNSLPLQAQFAVLLYHRWCVRMAMEESFPTKPSKVPIIQVPGLVDPNLSSANAKEMVMKVIHSTVEKSRLILDKYLQQNHDLFMPITATFGTLNEDSDDLINNWNKGILIPKEEMICQVGFDLACACFQIHQCSKAQSLFEQTDRYLKQVKAPLFCSVDIEKLKGYCDACSSLQIIDRRSNNTYEILQYAMRELKCEDVVKLLEADTIKQELCLEHKESVQEKLASVQQCSESQGFQILTCVTLCRIQKGQTEHCDFIKKLQSGGKETVEYFLKICSELLHDKGVTKLHRQNVKNYLKFLCLTLPDQLQMAQKMSKCPEIKCSFTNEEWKQFSKEQSAVSKTKFGKGEPSKRAMDSEVEVGEAESKLLASYDPKEIISLICQLLKTCKKHSIMLLTDKWRISKDIHLATDTLPSILDQIYVHVLVAKANLCVQVGWYKAARTLLQAVEATIKDTSYKLSRLIRWEALNIDLSEYQALGTFSPGSNLQDLCKRAKSCIVSLRIEKDIFPGPDILMGCATVLLCNKDWKYVSGLTSTDIGSLELSRLVSDVCQELPIINNARKPARILWEAVIRIFTLSMQQKRTSSGVPSLIPREAHVGLLPQAFFMIYLKKIKEPVAVSMFISLLTKLYNNLRSDITMELSREYDSMWPTALGSASSVNVLGITEAVTIIMEHALTVDPTHTSWLCTQADLCYVHGQYSKALRYYLEADAVATEYFADPFASSTFDDKMVERMIKCCNSLQCYTQVAVLCQFYENVDYTQAFKALQEKNCHDATDKYYAYFWDITILEFLVNYHTKRGEIKKQQVALTAMGQLELNSHNPADILKEAERVRRTNFLRTMVKQYLQKDGI